MIIKFLAKRKLRKLYAAYMKERDIADCGHALLQEVNSRAARLASEFDALMDTLPDAPKDRLRVERNAN